MKIKKSRIKEIIEEELASHIRELLEADKPGVTTADKENPDKEPELDSKNSAPKVGAKKDDAKPDGDLEPPEDKPTGDESVPGEDVPTPEEPADAEISKDVEEPEPEDENDVGGDISDSITGHQIQSITMEPESKMMPGAKEITIQFESDPHPLKILLGKSGMIKFHYKGSLHNEL